MMKAERKIASPRSIPGPVQYFLDMRSPDIIIAIHKNPEAPTYHTATYGTVGDVYEAAATLIRRSRT
jgi:electron transfer flavoprotein alpha subunit